MDQLGSSSQLPSTKVERRLVEKNRRNQMKILYSQLNSLLPTHNPKNAELRVLQEALPLPDQIDEAINYIKSLEEKMKTAKEKKESLERNRNKRSGESCSSSSAIPKKPQLEINEMGSSLEVVLTRGLDDQFIFYEIIRLLHQENVEIKSANSYLSGDSMLHVVHAEIPQSCLQFGASKISERLERFISGSCSDLEMQSSKLWDFEIDTDLWGF